LVVGPVTWALTVRAPDSSFALADVTSFALADVSFLTHQSRPWPALITIHR
jgi:hypothetical protein